MSYKVFVDDNFHYQVNSERHELGEYESYEAAVTVCKRVVDQYLSSAFKEGVTAAELYRSYITFGQDPFVVPGPEKASFSAWAYAKRRCSEMADET
jgi:hypothetical protein